MKSFTLKPVPVTFAEEKTLSFRQVFDAVVLNRGSAQMEISRAAFSGAARITVGRQLKRGA